MNLSNGPLYRLGKIPVKAECPFCVAGHKPKKVLYIPKDNVMLIINKSCAVVSLNPEEDQSPKAD